MDGIIVLTGFAPLRFYAKNTQIKNYLHKKQHEWLSRIFLVPDLI